MSEIREVLINRGAQLELETSIPSDVENENSIKEDKRRTKMWTRRRLTIMSLVHCVHLIGTGSGEGSLYGGA